jgi:hypothetical protein
VASKNNGRARRIQIHPDAEALEKLKAGLPKFEAHDVTGILQLPADEAKKEAVRVTASVINGQLDELLKALGVDRFRTDAWRRGFELLAKIHYGTGCFTFNQPAPPNRNAAKRSPELDRLLYEFVKELKKKDVEQTTALRMIAKDPKKCRQLKLSSNSRSQKPDHELKFETLRKRWISLSKRASPSSLLAALTGDYPIYGSEKDKANWRPNLLELPPLASLGKSNAT